MNFLLFTKMSNLMALSYLGSWCLRVVRTRRDTSLPNSEHVTHSQLVVGYISHKKVPCCKRGAMKS